jgi:hypothetical protein
VVKIGILPIMFRAQEQYMPVHPDVFGQKWNPWFSVTPSARKSSKRIYRRLALQLDDRGIRYALVISLELLVAG